MDAGRIRIGTRGSALARWQADWVAARLGRLRPELEREITVVKTAGDKILDTALSKIGGKGLFTKELEQALLDRRIDLAIHSLKDLPTVLPDGLDLGAVLEREDPRDVLVAAAGRTFAELPAGARIGTSSLRRRAQLLALRPDLAPVDVRGNVPTRIDKVVRGELPAVVLAKAGVTRLGLEAKITEVFEPERLLPAVGQGAIAVEIRRNDGELRELLAPLDHQPTRLAITAERVLLRRLEGGCQVPIGALGRWVNRELVLDGLVADLDGTQVLRDTERGPVADCAEAELAGERLAQKLLDRGADRILAQIAAAARPGTAARS